MDSAPAASSPAASRAELFAMLDRLGVVHTTTEHEPVFTVEESDKIDAIIPGGHTKNLFLKDRKGGLWLICALSQARVDLNALAKLLGVQRFSFGPPDLMREALGVTPGSVTAFALINDRLNRVGLVLDQGLTACSMVNFHPLSNDATTSITPDGLFRFLEETGHRPVLVDFAAPKEPRLAGDQAH